MPLLIFLGLIALAYLVVFLSLAVCGSFKKCKDAIMIDVNSDGAQFVDTRADRPEGVE